MTILPASFQPEVTNRVFIDSAADMGAAARAAGEPIGSNPFVPDSPVFEAFAFGWNLEPTLPVVAPSKSGPFALSAVRDALALSPESKGDLTALQASDVCAARDLAEGVAEWLKGEDHAPARVIASGLILCKHLATSKAGHAACVESLARSEAANSALRKECEELRRAKVKAEGDSAHYREQRDAANARAVRAEALAERQLVEHRRLHQIAHNKAEAAERQLVEYRKLRHIAHNKAEAAERQVAEYRTLLAALPAGIAIAYPSALPLLKAFLADRESEA